jgi:RND superfamily putative drug exporter
VYILLDDNSSFELDRDYLIGRAPEESDAIKKGLRPFRLEDPTGNVSRAHAEIRIRDGQVAIVDRESTNGVYLRQPGAQAWTRLTPWTPTPWLPGAYIRIGNRVLRRPLPDARSHGRGLPAARRGDLLRAP